MFFTSAGPAAAAAARCAAASSARVMPGDPPARAYGGLTPICAARWRGSSKFGRKPDRASELRQEGEPEEGVVARVLAVADDREVAGLHERRRERALLALLRVRDGLRREHRVAEISGEREARADVVFRAEVDA